MNKLKKVLPAITLISILLGIWSLIVTRSGSAIFPMLWKVVTGTVELIHDGTLFDHIGASLLRVGAGFLIATAVALPLGLWMGRVTLVYRTLNPVFQILRPISPIAWIPIAILWFGIGDTSPIFLIFISTVFPLVVQTATGVHSIEPRFLQAAENFGVPRWKLYLKVIWPAALPQVIVGMRISVGVAWLVVVAAEMIALRSGLGYMIIDARNAGNRYDFVVSGMVVIGLIGLLLDALMRRLEGLRSVRWRYAR
jgi:NitT/TauT family transport system permease protein